MSDTTTTTTETTAPAEETAKTTETKTETSAKTPEWYEAELTRVRNEAAKHRTSKNDAVTAAKEEVTKEWETKLQAAEHDKDVLQLSYLKLMAALPKDQKESVVQFASLLQGSSEEELEAHAEKVRSLFGGNSPKPQPAVDKTPSGGQPLALNDDGLEEALKRALGVD